MKKLLYLFLALGGLWCLWNHETLLYGFRQAKGQANILFNTEPIEAVLVDKAFPDSLKKRIKLIQEIKQFSVDSLGLEPSGSYNTFYNQHGKPILWVITASEPFAMKAKVFDFPILGQFSYKGHFEYDITQKEEQELKKAGYDTQINEVSAWSTLGYLKDPILSSMLYKSEGRLAALIIHELTHGTLFVKNNLTFNENLADFVGDYGALRFLAAKYGRQSSEFLKYEQDKRFADAYSQAIMQGAKKLDSLYKNFSPKLTSEQKQTLKTATIKQVMQIAEQQLANFKKSKRRRFDENNLPNNAFFIGFLTYQSKQNEFEQEFEQKFNRNFAQYLAYLKQTANQ